MFLYIARHVEICWIRCEPHNKRRHRSASYSESIQPSSNSCDICWRSSALIRVAHPHWNWQLATEYRCVIMYITIYRDSNRQACISLSMFRSGSCYTSNIATSLWNWLLNVQTPSMAPTHAQAASTTTMWVPWQKPVGLEIGKLRRRPNLKHHAESLETLCF